MPASVPKVAVWASTVVLGIGLILVLCAGAAVAAAVTVLARAADQALTRNTAARDRPAGIVGKEKPAAAGRTG